VTRGATLLGQLLTLGKEHQRRLDNVSRKHMLERGRRGPSPHHIFPLPGRGYWWTGLERCRLFGATARPLSVRFRLVDLVQASQNCDPRKPMGLVKASDSDRLARLLTVNAYRPN